MRGKLSSVSYSPTSLPYFPFSKLPRLCFPNCWDYRPGCTRARVCVCIKVYLYIYIYYIIFVSLSDRILLYFFFCLILSFEEEGPLICGFLKSLDFVFWGSGLHSALSWKLASYIISSLDSGWCLFIRYQMPHHCSASFNTASSWGSQYRNIYWKLQTDVVLMISFSHWLSVTRCCLSYAMWSLRERTRVIKAVLSFISVSLFLTFKIWNWFHIIWSCPIKYLHIIMNLWI